MIATPEKGDRVVDRKRLLVQGMIVVAALVLTLDLACAAEDTTGKVTIETMSAGVGFGVTWGEGVLEYRGENIRSRSAASTSATSESPR